MEDFSPLWVFQTKAKFGCPKSRDPLFLKPNQKAYLFLHCLHCIPGTMADCHSSKPFSPDEIQKILHHLQQPAVFTNMTCDWPALQWTAERLSDSLGDKPIRFRLGRKEERNGKNQRPIPKDWGEIIAVQFITWL